MQINLAPWFTDKLILDIQKVVFWPAKSTLIISDWHLGKVSHFRKHGIGIPSDARFKSIADFELLMRTYEPSRVLFLGDLFHSDYNLEWEEFGLFISQYEGVEFLLVEGNHDILHPSQYAKFGIRVIRDQFRDGEFLFSHEPIESEFEGYNIAGHVHPGVRLSGKGKQAISLACFYFSERQAILPAFGALTGKYIIKPKKQDKVFVAADVVTQVL